jgi:hypothetical protein
LERSSKQFPFLGLLVRIVLTRERFGEQPDYFRPLQPARAAAGFLLLPTGFILLELFGVAIRNPEYFYWNNSMAKTRGRPPKAAEERQARTLQIGLTDEEWAQIETAAANDKPVKWARTILLKAAKRAQKR